MTSTPPLCRVKGCHHGSDVDETHPHIFVWFLQMCASGLAAQDQRHLQRECLAGASGRPASDV